MTQVDTEMQRIVEKDATYPLPPDLDVITAAGRRRLRRRRLGTGVAACAAVGSLAAPAYLLVGGGDTAADPAAPPDPVPTATGPCGQLFCGEPRKDAASERAALVGEPWVVGVLADGTEEVIYAANARGVDLSTNEEARVDVLMLGHRADGALRRAAWTVQPGSEGVSPDGDQVRFWSSPSLLGNGSGDEYLVVGFVEGTPEAITWSTPDGARGPVDGTSTTVIDGYTVFYLTRPYPGGHERDDMRLDTDGHEVQEKDGEVVLGDDGGPELTQDLTIHTSDGWSCSLAECGSVG